MQDVNLQEAQEKSLAVHAALCNDVPERAQFVETPPTSSDRATPEVIQLQQEVTDDTSKSPADVFNITGNSTEHGMDGNDEDLVNLARIQDGIPLSYTIALLLLQLGGVTGESEIAEMWQDHYKSILNSVKNSTRQQFVTNKLREESIMFSTEDINVALHSLKRGKSCGVDGLASEHFMFAHRI